MSVRSPFPIFKLAFIFILIGLIHGCGESASSKPVPAKDEATSIIDKKMNDKTKSGLKK